MELRVFTCISIHPHTHTHLTPPQYSTVVKASLDLLLVFVNYTESNEGGNLSALLGGDSPARMDSPDALPCALLFKDAIEEVAESTGMCEGVVGACVWGRWFTRWFTVRSGGGGLLCVKASMKRWNSLLLSKSCSL